MSTGLNLNDIEQQRADEFKARHCGKIYYKVWFTGIGVVVIICCEGCKAEEDISNYECW